MYLAEHATSNEAISVTEQRTEKGIYRIILHTTHIIIHILLKSIMEVL